MTLDRVWKLGVDLHPKDNIIECQDFEGFILAVANEEPNITEKTVRKVRDDVVGILLQDMDFLIENNMEEIIRRARVGEY